MSGCSLPVREVISEISLETRQSSRSISSGFLKLIGNIAFNIGAQRSAVGSGSGQAIDNARTVGEVYNQSILG